MTRATQEWVEERLDKELYYMKNYYVGSYNHFVRTGRLTDIAVHLNQLERKLEERTKELEWRIRALEETGGK